DMKHIGSELNAVADGAEFGRAFEHAGRSAAARQRQRRGQPAKPAADDKNGFTRHRFNAYTLVLPIRLQPEHILPEHAAAGIPIQADMRRGGVSVAPKTLQGMVEIEAL